MTRHPFPFALIAHLCLQHGTSMKTCCSLEGCSGSMAQGTSSHQQLHLARASSSHTPFHCNPFVTQRKKTTNFGGCVISIMRNKLCIPFQCFSLFYFSLNKGRESFNKSNPDPNPHNINVMAWLLSRFSMIGKKKKRTLQFNN